MWAALFVGCPVNITTTTTAAFTTTTTTTATAASTTITTITTVFAAAPPPGYHCRSSQPFIIKDSTVTAIACLERQPSTHSGPPQKLVEMSIMRYPNSTISPTLEVESGGRLSRSGTVVVAALKGTDQTHLCRGGLAALPSPPPAACSAHPSPLTAASSTVLDEPE
ncbi:hypothetical protein E2C01_025250 [Portunus trituberculatus]|uniref:Uncharacterized protein n=1 Tax=Portunus trituberculatus TaxID=210409 RepID=A0A5B7ECG9_PORTR|nr:hypothetical protein [Portunus trituberculatus]